MKNARQLHAYPDRIIETLLANPELIDTLADAINSARLARMTAARRRTG